MFLSASKGSDDYNNKVPVPTHMCDLSLTMAYIVQATVYCTGTVNIGISVVAEHFMQDVLRHLFWFLLAPFGSTSTMNHFKGTFHE